MSVQCAPFNEEVETISKFLQRFKVQGADSLHDAGRHEKKRASILVKALPVKIVTDLQRRLKPVLLSDATYAVIEEKLLQQFEVKKSIVGASLTFMNRKQRPNESLENYAKELNDLAADCGYSDCCRDRLIRDVFVMGLKSTKVLSAVLPKSEKKTFNECVEHAKLFETLSMDAEEIKAEATSSSYSTEVNQTIKLPLNYICIRCGAKRKHAAKDCFAIKLKCRKCNKLGHIAKVCKAQTGAAHYTTADHDELESYESHQTSSTSHENGMHHSAVAQRGCDRNAVQQSKDWWRRGSGYDVRAASTCAGGGHARSETADCPPTEDVAVLTKNDINLEDFLW